jgi:prevent-host-death family protein
MTRVSMTKARQDFTNIANRVMFEGQRICIEKNNKPAVAVVSIEDLEMIEAIEDRIDIQAAKAALKKGKFITLDALKKQLGL